MGRTFSEGYLWLLYSWYPQEWWTTGAVYDTTCRSEEIQSALDHAIIIDYLPLSDEAEGREEETDAGLVSERTSYFIVLTLYQVGKKIYFMLL